VVAFGLTAAAAIALAVIFGPGAVPAATGALAAATAVAALVMELQRHNVAPATAAAGKPAGARQRRRPWLIFLTGLVVIAAAGAVLLVVRAPRGVALLGPPNFSGYCHATGQGDVRLTVNNAYGWRCTAASDVGDDAGAVCAWTFQTSRVTSRVANFDDPFSWQCWRVTHRLGPLDFAAYCTRIGHPGVTYLAGHNAYGWHCAGSGGGIDTQRACATQYDRSPVVSRFANFYDKDSWECWA
jgi:hypothetical protein